MTRFCEPRQSGTNASNYLSKSKHLHLPRLRKITQSGATLEKEQEFAKVSDGCKLVAMLQSRAARQFPWWCVSDWLPPLTCRSIAIIILDGQLSHNVVPKDELCAKIEILLIPQFTQLMHSYQFLCFCCFIDSKLDGTLT